MLLRYLLFHYLLFRLLTLQFFTCARKSTEEDIAWPLTFIGNSVRSCFSVYEFSRYSFSLRKYHLRNRSMSWNYLDRNRILVIEEYTMYCEKSSYRLAVFNLLYNALRRRDTANYFVKKYMVASSANIFDVMRDAIVSLIVLLNSTIYLIPRIGKIIL